MQSKSLNMGRPFYLRQETEGEQVVLDMGSHVCSVFCRKSPSKASGNEDMAAVLQLSPDSGIFMVTDGMGGQKFGAEASQIVCEEVMGALLNCGIDDVTYAARVGIEKAHKKIRDLGAGSTVAIVEIKGDKMRSIHVGDSQILTFGRKGKIKVCTTNHSPQGFAFAAGLNETRLDFDEDQKHLLCNAVGLDGMSIEIGVPQIFNKYDTLVMTSDGVHEHFENEELVRTAKLSSVEDGLAEISKKIIENRGQEKSKTYGYEDDWTALVMRRKYRSQQKLSKVS